MNEVAHVQANLDTGCPGLASLDVHLLRQALPEVRVPARVHAAGVGASVVDEERQGMRVLVVQAEPVVARVPLHTPREHDPADEVLRVSDHGPSLVLHAFALPFGLSSSSSLFSLFFSVLFCSSFFSSGRAASGVTCG